MGNIIKLALVILAIWMMATGGEGLVILALLYVGALLLKCM